MRWMLLCALGLLGGCDVDMTVGEAGSELGRTMTLGDIGADGTEELLISEPGTDRVWILDPSALFPD